MTDTFTLKEREALQVLCNKFSQIITIDEREKLIKEIQKIGEQISQRVGYDVEINISVINTMNYLTEILKQIKNKKNPVIGELGADRGASTLTIAKWIRKNKSGKFIVIEWFKGSKGAVQSDIDGRIKNEFLNRMNEYEDIYTLMQMSSEEAAVRIKDNTFDWFWIDADHRYSCVKKDIELWYPKIKNKGILAGHDYNNKNYDEKYIEQDMVNDIHHGVTKAVNERFGIPNYYNNFWWIRKK